LLGVLAALLAVIALGTVWAVFIRPASRAEPALGNIEAGGVPQASGASGPVRRIFTGMGRLRVRLAAPADAESGGTALVTVVFPYDDSDRAFVEELAHNIGKFRALTTEYFELIPADSPLLVDEQTLKDDLLSRYNRLLRLGRIDTLYFSEFIIIN
jgi:flagellar basal body-associated protein FliL